MRIEAAGGVVTPIRDANGVCQGPARAWNSQVGMGIAMSRSIGD